MARVSIHPSLSRFLEDNSLEFLLNESTLGEILPAVFRKHPRLRDALLNENHDLHGYVNLYVGGRNAKNMSLSSSIADDDEIEIFTSLIGG